MKKTLLVPAMVLLLAVGVNAAFEKVNTYNNNFSDVTDANWFCENVKTAYELGFMNGKSEGKFDPNGNVTVAEGITMASRLHAIFNGVDIAESNTQNEYKIEFDSMVGLRLNHAVGDVENGVLKMQPDAPMQAEIMTRVFLSMVSDWMREFTIK